MDPISVIVTALSAGAAAAVDEAATQAVKDAHQSLRELIRRKLGRHPEGEQVLAQHQAGPEEGGDSLAKALSEVGAGEDGNLVEVAREVLELVGPQYAPRYHLEVAGNVQGVVQGDHASVTQNFSAPRAAE